MDYINELNKLSPSYCIPESCNNMYDFGIYTNRAIIDVYNETMFIVLGSQLSILDESVILENKVSEKLKEVKDKVISGFKTILQKIKGLFQKVATFISNLFKKTKSEIFTKATKSEFEKAVEFFKSYDGTVKFISDKDDNSDQIFFGTENFTKEVDQYNNLILSRASDAFNTLNGFYNNANINMSKSIWFGRDKATKEEAIKELKNSKSKNVFAYILYGDENTSISDSFGKKEIEAAIYSELSNASFLRTEITSTNLHNFAPKIKKAVYSDNSGKWNGITKNNYEILKNMINNAIKTVDTGIFIDSEELSNVANPTYTLDYMARCEDIIKVLVAVNSTMNNMIFDMYKKNIKLVCRILNTYWKLNKEKKSVQFDPNQVQPSYS